MQAQLHTCVPCVSSSLRPMSLVSSYIQPCSLRQGLRPRDLPVAKSSLVTSIPRPQVLVVFQPQLVPAHGFGCVAPGCARNCLAAFQATLSMGLGGDLG